MSLEDGNGDAPESPSDGLFSAMSPYNWTVQQEQPWHRAAALLAAHGAGVVKISKAFERSYQTVSNLFKQPFFQEMVREEMAAAQRDIRKLFQDELFTNLQTLKAIRDDPDELATPRIGAIREINDRALGRPVQPVVETNEAVCANPVEEAARLEAECKRLAKELNFTLDD
jgi:hypothetical protein